MFSDPRSDHIFRIFGYVPGLYIFYSIMWQLSTYLEDGKVLESTVSRFPIESNWPKKEYYFTPNIEPNLKYYFEKYFENSVD